MRIEEATSTTIAELLGKVDVLLIPIGTIEAHGPHCSVMGDALIAQGIAEEIERIAGDRVIIAPLIPYGHNWVMKDRPGSHTMPVTTLSEFVFEVIRGFQPWKIRYVILLNGHGENTEALHAAAEKSVELGIKTIVLSWWVRGFRDEFAGVAQDLDGHAGEAETSILMHVGEKYVDRKLIPKKEESYPPAPMAGTSGDLFDEDVRRASYPKGYAGKPFAASPEKGKILIDKTAKVVVEVIDALKLGTITR